MNFQDCEYVEFGPSTTQRLEEQIAGVEARIRGLNPAAPVPYPNHQRSSVPSDRSLHHDVMQQLTSNFYAHAAQFGFFLDIPVSSSTLTPALTSTIQLWSIHLSNSNFGHELESEYLSRAVRATTDALSPPSRPQSPSPYALIPTSNPQDHPRIILQAIQCHILLATYFFRNARLLEGKYHLGTAVGLVLGAGMHRRISTGSSARNNAFWTVYTMDCCWTSADGSPSNFPQDMQSQVDVHWPQETSSSPHGLGTITAFLTSRSMSGTSAQALYAKAAILYERASRLVIRYRPQMPPEELNNFFLAFTNIDTVIQQFRQTFFSQSPQDHPHLVAHILTHVATIQLHNLFVGDREAESSRRRVLDAATGVVQALATIQQLRLDDVDPIMGTLLTATGQVFLISLAAHRSTVRVSGRHATWPESGVMPLKASVERILDVMGLFASRSKLMDSQHKALRESLGRAMQS
ncbi:Zn(2)-C6 fungal-type domain-containing protein [Mycena indigotica]|uniref:Zn(2)-C6 fungal-type domain-containing protein n=1 Tax=Mycena indigotica TaxID=2126181 RepID=A0A8H6W210_9AGAR|nr:Zn(2)-C6 fungal-type domain-containing protein [Mycena indigotica]KAF7302087.1 Zn(2)-C6 fungal-type domain-containing protein [Mycena indigotica]